MFCKNCGKEIKNNKAFCSGCGAKVEQDEAVQINPINTTEIQSSMTSSTNTNVAVKKMSKGKSILIAVFAVLIIIVIACALGEGDSNSPFGEYSEADMLKSITISTVRDQFSVKHDQDVYDIKVLDADGKYNYIVSATTESKQGFETWWILLLKFDIDSGNYQSYVHYHGEDTRSEKIDGDRFSKNNIPEYYKTNDEFGWGKENHIE